ncbi:MAG: LolA family protein [Bacteroidia bacterium]
MRFSFITFFRALLVCSPMLFFTGASTKSAVRAFKLLHATALKAKQTKYISIHFRIDYFTIQNKEVAISEGDLKLSGRKFCIGPSVFSDYRCNGVDFWYINYAKKNAETFPLPDTLLADSREGVPICWMAYIDTTGFQCERLADTSIAGNKIVRLNLVSRKLDKVTYKNIVVSINQKKRQLHSYKTYSKNGNYMNIEVLKYDTQTVLSDTMFVPNPNRVEIISHE